MMQPAARLAPPAARLFAEPAPSSPVPLGEAGLSHCRLARPVSATRLPRSDWLGVAPSPGRAVAAAAAAWRRRGPWRRRRRRRRWGFLPASASARLKRARRCATGRSARCFAGPCCRCARRGPPPRSPASWVPGAAVSPPDPPTSPGPAERPRPLALPPPPVPVPPPSPPRPRAAGSPGLSPRPALTLPRDGGRLGARWGRPWTKPPGRCCTTRPPASGTRSTSASSSVTSSAGRSSRTCSSAVPRGTGIPPRPRPRQGGEGPAPHPPPPRSVPSRPGVREKPPPGAPGRGGLRAGLRRGGVRHPRADRGGGEWGLSSASPPGTAWGTLDRTGWQPLASRFPTCLAHPPVSLSRCPGGGCDR